MLDRLLFSSIVDEFLKERKSRGRSIRTLNLYRFELDKFSQFLNNNNIFCLQEVTPGILREWFTQLSTHRNKNGVHCNYRIIKTLLRWSILEYDLECKNPINKVFIEQGKNLPLEEIPLEVIGKLLLAAEKGNQSLRDKTILKLLLDTGLRGSELVALNLCDIDLKSGRILVHYAKMGIPAIVYVGKNSLFQLKEYLRFREDNLSPLFITDKNTRLTFEGLRMLIIRLCKRAGVKTYGVHCFRRTFALEIYRKTKDIFLVSKLLRHSKIEVTIRYLNVGDEELQESFLSVSPADNLV